MPSRLRVLSCRMHVEWQPMPLLRGWLALLCWARYYARPCRCFRATCSTTEPVAHSVRAVRQRVGYSDSHRIPCDLHRIPCVCSGSGCLHDGLIAIADATSATVPCTRHLQESIHASRAPRGIYGTSLADHSQLPHNNDPFDRSHSQHCLKVDHSPPLHRWQCTVCCQPLRGPCLRISWGVAWCCCCCCTVANTAARCVGEFGRVSMVGCLCLSLAVMRVGAAYTQY